MPKEINIKYMNTDKKHNYENYFDEEPEEEKKDIPQANKKKQQETYKMPIPPSKKKAVRSNLKEMNIDEYNYPPDEDEDFLDLKNELNMELLEQSGYKFVPLDQLKDYINEAELEKIEKEDVILSPENEITALEQYLQANPCDYNCLVKLMDLYRQNGIQDKLKEIRVYTQNLYPLSQEMWLDWISDEFQALPKEDFDKMFEFKDMYRKSISDFLYLKICKKYLKYMMALLTEIESKKIEEKYQFNFQTVRHAFEEILEIWGLDFNKSSKIWDLYLKFETRNFKRFNGTNDVEASKTFNLIRSIFRRRLSFPHVDLDIVWQEYSKWESEEEEKIKIEKKYKESSNKVSSFINFEEKLGDLINQTMKENDSAELRNFLSSEVPKLSNKNFNYVRLFYERVLQMNPDDENIWENFISIAQKKEYKVSQNQYLSILQKASKCCYFNINLWILHLREMEKQGFEKQEIDKKIVEAYHSAENERGKYEIWKFSLEYSCRNFSGDEDSLDQLRKDFEKCLDQISHFENKEFLVKIYIVWSEFEAYKTNNYDKVKEAMEKAVRICGGDSHVWRSYVEYLKHSGNLKEVRSVFKRAVQYVKDDNLYFSQQWVSWEKIFGSPGDIEAALAQSRKIVEKAEKDNKKKSKALKGKKLSHSTKIASNEENNSNEDEIIVEREELTQHYANKENIVSEDKKREDIIPEETKKVKIDLKQQKDESDGENSDQEIENLISSDNKSKVTVYVNNIPSEVTDDELLQFILQENKKLKVLECRVVRDKKGLSRGFAFVDFPDQIHAEKCVSILHKSEFQGHELLCAISKPPSEGENDSRTIFVNNLPFSIDEDKISNTFSCCGEILDIRIIKDKQTSVPKGYCYVEFQKEGSVEKALLMTDLKIDGRKIIVKRSQSDVKMREKLKHVVYMTNLAYSTQEKDIAAFFLTHGVDGIEDIHIVTNEDGSSKGFAFVQFDKEQGLKEALKCTGKLLNNRAITIRVSKRNITRKINSETKLEDHIPISKRKKQINSNPTEEKKNWSNEDFLKLLSKK